MKFTNVRRALHLLAVVSATGGLAAQAKEPASATSMLAEVVAIQAKQFEQSQTLQKQINELRSKIDSLSAQCGQGVSSKEVNSKGTDCNSAVSNAKSGASANCVQQQAAAQSNCACIESVNAVQPANTRQSLQWVETNRYRVIVPASQAAALLSQARVAGSNVYSLLPTTELYSNGSLASGTGQVLSAYPSYPILQSPSGSVVTNGNGIATYGGYGFTSPATTNAITLRGDVIRNDVWPASGGLRTHIVSDSGWQTVYYRGANGVSISPSPQFPQVVTGR